VGVKRLRASREEEYVGWVCTGILCPPQEFWKHNSGRLLDS
jgi:hypothetical protein